VNGYKKPFTLSLDNRNIFKKAPNSETSGWSLGWVWGLTSVIPVLRRLKEEDHEFKASQDFIASI
jgi:hypothetical protein